jgi:predicted dehydrogenase
MVGHLLLYQPAIAWMRDAIAGGRIGRVLHVETRRLSLGTVRRVENVLWSFSPHDLAVIRVLLGEPDLRVVRAVGQCAIQPSVADLVHADFGFADGTTAHVHAAWLWPHKLRCTTVIGDAGAIVYDELAQRVTLHRTAIDRVSLQTINGGEEVVSVAAGDPLRRECQTFLDCIADRTVPPSHGRHGVEVVRMLAEADKAMKT